MCQLRIVWIAIKISYNVTVLKTAVEALLKERVKIRMPLDDCEDDGFMECCADFSGTFEVESYDRESIQFTTNISVNYQKR